MINDSLDKLSKLSLLRGVNNDVLKDRRDFPRNLSNFGRETWKKPFQDSTRVEPLLPAIPEPRPFGAIIHDIAARYEWHISTPDLRKLEKLSIKTRKAKLDLSCYHWRRCESHRNMSIKSIFEICNYLTAFSTTWYQYHALTNWAMKPQLE